MLTDLYTSLQLLLRWVHVIAGIVWIGHLYFFNFVNLQFQGTIGADIKKVVNPQLLGRAFWWFRYGAMTTFVVGLILFTQLYMYTPGVGFGPSALFSTPDGITGRANTFMSGPMLFGMLAPNHFGGFDIPSAVVAIGLGILAIWWAYRISPNVGKI